MKSSIARVLLVLMTATLCSPALRAQQSPWEDYSRHIGKARGLGSLTTQLFGDSVDLYTGRVSFQQTDITLEGNSALPVSLSRSFSPRDPVVSSAWGLDPPVDDQPLADWTLDVPRVGGTFAHLLTGNVLGPGGLIINPGTIYNWSDQRCSGLRVPPWVGEFAPMDYWNGLQASMPGGGEMLAPTAGLPAPNNGATQRWVTTSRTSFSCLSSIKNASGEGFLALDAHGNHYWFDWMAKFHEPTLKKSFYYSISTPTGGFEEYLEQQMERRRSMLYVTRIQDRFGNWVNYRYSNAADQPVRLDAIEASDGRSIILTHNAAGRITSATAAGRTWTYGYSADGQALTSVTQPDGSNWTFNLGNYVRSMGISGADVSSCNYPGVVVEAASLTNTGSVLSMKHPSGANGEFELRPKLHGRSNVPQHCVPVAGSDNPETGADYSDYVRFYWANSLVSRRISGPGLTDMQWSYTYNNSQTPAQAASFLNHPASYAPPGSWAPRPYSFTYLADGGKPVTDITTYIITDPVCVSDACAGSVSTVVTGPDTWERYTFGSSYRYNERKLLRRETAKLNGPIARTESFVYELARDNLSYQPIVGATRQYQGDGITDAALRPLKIETTQQDGMRYVRTTQAFDSLARPTQILETSSPEN